MSTHFRNYDPAGAAAFSRACFATLHAAAKGDVSRDGVAGLIRELWPDAHKAPTAVVRAAVSPMTSTILGANVVADYVGSLAPQSAFSRLSAAATQIDLANINSVAIPKRVGRPTATAAWVRPGGPWPVRQDALTDNFIGPPKKLGMISVISRELAEIASGESVVSAILREDIALSLDAAVFSNAAATADAPAGLLNGVTAITASAATSANERMLADLEALSGAVIANGGVDVIFIAAVRQWNAARLRLGANRATVWPSPALADGTVIAVEPTSVVTSLGSVPKLEVSSEATLVMNDVPAALSSVGTPNVVAAPARSMFQTDTLALKTSVDLALTMRAEGRVAYLTGATWGAPPTP